MSTRSYFGVEPLRYLGPDAAASLGYRYYDKDRLVRGKRMEDHLRLAVCYWHTFVGDGADVFGAGTFQRAWH
ncbi:MAG: xylose isomerase, partial [Polyangiaceae bacterium]|nr:xylose isomerase [Polyangiaceae bacterium]